jgi:hypothetical protein
MKMARGCTGISELMERAMQENAAAFYQPLPAEEVLKIVASAWEYELSGKNWIGRGCRVVMENDVIDSLAPEDPYALALLTILKRSHWRRDFVLANAFAAEHGWTLPKFRKARDVLVEQGLIVCIHRGGKGPHDPPVYRFP